MLGRATSFKCASCDHKGIMHLGATQHYNIKGVIDDIVIKPCPECEKYIGFKLTSRNEEPTESYIINDYKDDDIEATNYVFY